MRLPWEQLKVSQACKRNPKDEIQAPGNKNTNHTLLIEILKIIHRSFTLNMILDGLFYETTTDDDIVLRPELFKKIGKIR